MRKRQQIRYKIRWKRLFLLILIFLLTATTLAGAMVYLYSHFFYTYKQGNMLVQTDLKSSEAMQKRVNILLLGIDDPDPQTPGSTVRRSDTMILASIDPEACTINLLSIPRDTKTTVSGRKGYDKITHAYAYGGPALAVRTVEDLLGVPVNYYAAIDWQGFIKVIDILGGVDLYVEQNMYYDDPYADLAIQLTKGYQHLDGQKAGQYVRFRHDELGDIGRVQRQQRFLKALTDELLQVGTIPKIPSLIATTSQYVSTDMNTFTLIKLANTLKSIKGSGFHAEMLPGDFATLDGLSYWVPDQAKLRQLVQRLFVNNASVSLGETQGSRRNIN